MQRHKRHLHIPVCPAGLAAIALAAAAGCGSDGATFTVGDSPAPPSISVDVDSGEMSASVDHDGHDALEPVTDGTVTLPEGWWEMSGYGTVLHVDGDEIVVHHVTASTCAVGDDVDNELPVDHASQDDGGVITVDLVGPTTDYRLLPLADAPDCPSDTGESLTALDELFADHYPFFSERDHDWDSSIDTIRATVADDPEAFEAALAAFMIDLADGHTTLDGLSIDPNLDRFGMADIATIDGAAVAMQAELDATLARVDGLRTDAAGSVGWGMLDDSVGYLLIAGFEGDDADDDPVADRDGLVETLDVAIADLSERADGVVVDVRFNQGGYEDLAVLAAGYFVDDVSPAYRKSAHAQPDPFVQTIDVEPQSVRFDGDVVVLTSPVTASAAEVFALAMVEVADATIIGSPSFGEFSDAIDWVLPNGIEFSLSMEVYTDLDGTNHEVTGVPVDVDVPFDESLATAIDHLS